MMNYFKAGVVLILLAISLYIGWNYYLYYTSESAPTIEIQEVSLPSWILLDKQGYFSDTAGAKELFKRVARKHNALSRPMFIKKMSKEAQIAQFGTAQLYKVTCEDGKKYILKEIKGETKAKKEIKRLEQVRSSKLLAPYIGPKIKDNLQIIVPLAYVSYTHKGKKHILVIMRKAQGILLQRLMEKFKSNPHDRTTQKIHAKAYYNLGVTLACFYRTHGSLYKTIAHQDPHTGNIFYFEDDANWIITLIDNEHMAYSLAKLRSISVDLGHLFATSPFVMQWAQPDFLNNFDAKKWYSIVVPSFILGFIGRCPKKKRISVFKELKELMFTWDSKVINDTSRHMRGLIKEQFDFLEQQLVTEYKNMPHSAGRSFAIA